MKKLFIIGLMLGICLLFACSASTKDTTESLGTSINNDVNNWGTYNQNSDNQNNYDQNSHNQDGKNASEPDVSIDFEHLKNAPGFDLILQTLQMNLTAIVEKDKEQFASGFSSEQSTEANQFWIDNENKYRFTGVDSIIYQPEESRLNVIVAYQYSSVADPSMKESHAGYTFKKAGDGQWKIAIID